jgi:hypothetical protein
VTNDLSRSGQMQDFFGWPGINKHV